jgi:hypothetical protein
MQHKWAWPFMEPVDVEGLKLHDYYEVKFVVFKFSRYVNQHNINHAILHSLRKCS